jgi:hypothetical protein
MVMTLRSKAALAALFVVALITAPAAVATPCDDPGAGENDPIGQGRFTTAEDVGWIYFKTSANQSCAIGPDGVIGCDDVPDGAPAGTNQVVATSSVSAVYRHSDTPTFTRDVDILQPGHKLEIGEARCGVGYQGTVSCRTPGGYGGHGFTIAGAYGILW